MFPLYYYAHWRVWVGGIVVVAMLGGCGDILGLEPTSPPASQNEVSFAVDAVYIGAEAQTVAVELDASKLKAWIVDAGAPGGFRELPVKFFGASALCTVPEGEEGLWELVMPKRFGGFTRVFPISSTTREWHAVVTTPGSQDASETWPPNPVLKLTTPLDTPLQPNETFNIYVAGPWIAHEFAYAGDVGATTFDIQFHSSQFRSRAGIEFYTIASKDRPYVNRYHQATLISTAKLQPFDLADGVNVVSGTHVPAGSDRKLNAMLNVSDVNARLQPHIAQGAQLAMNSWRLVAAPKGRIHFDAGPTLTAGDPGPVINVGYGNPFAGDGLVPMFYWRTHTSRVERDPDGSGWLHLAGLYLEEMEPGEFRTYSVDAGLPTSISLNDNSLVADKMSVAIGKGKPFEFSYTADRPDGEWRSLDCYRLDVDPQREAPVLSVRMLTDRIRIPESMLPRGKRYKCRMHLIRGSAKAQQGDDRERESAIRFGFLDSSSFTVP